MGSPHLAWPERYQIESLLAEGFSVAVIAARLGRHPSCIYDEIKRGRQPDGGYSAHHAQLLRDESAQRSAANHRVKPASVWVEVRDGIEHGWTPEQVTGRFDLVVGRAPDWGERVSVPAIYAWIRRGARNLLDCLRRLKRFKQGRGGHRGGGLPADRTRIAERPKAVQSRRTFGHWEGDSVLGTERKARLVTLVERKSRYLVLRRTLDGCSDTVGTAIINALAKLPVKSLTFDNGSEFAAYRRIEHSLECRTFFADPYSPWQRGTNENTNGLLRDFVSRRDRVSELSHQFLAAVAHKLNHRPRKCLGFRTPHEVLFGISPVGFRT
jgi:IS30 family transposase